MGKGFDLKMLWAMSGAGASKDSRVSQRVVLKRLRIKSTRVDPSVLKKTIKVLENKMIQVTPQNTSTQVH